MNNQGNDINNSCDQSSLNGLPGVELKDLGYDHCGEQEVKGKKSGLILLDLLNRGGSRNHMAR